MQKKSLKKILFKRFLFGNSKKDVKFTHAIFIILCTLVEIGFPIYFLLAEYKMAFPFNVLLIIGIIVSLFFIFMDLKEFFQSNYIDLLFYKLSTYIVFMLIAFILFVVNRWELVRAADLAGDPFSTWMIIIVFYIIFVIGTFVCVVVTDTVIVLILRLLALFLKIDMNNPYIEKLKYAKTVEGSEEYTRLRIKSEFENRFQESSIDEASFEQYCNEQYNNEGYKEVVDLNNQDYLFEHTKHFKKIVSLDQVDSRYEMLMKIYMPQCGSNYIPVICKEIQKEYQEIKDKK